MLWFKAKRYGWGWTPATLEGWLVLALFVVALGATVVWFLHRVRAGAPQSDAMPWFLAAVALEVAALVAIAWLTGERPRWRWGD
jgi:hypothetical protein